MLIVSRAARECLLSRLSRKKVATDVAMRFTRREGGWRLRPDHADPADTTIVHEGRSVLLLDEEVSKAMTNMKLDVRAAESGTGLKLRRVRRESE